MITAFPVDVNLTPDLPHFDDLACGGAPIESYFSQTAGPALQLALDFSRRDRAATVTADNGLDPAHLQQALALTVAPGDNNAVGLLFGDSLVDDPVLGLDASQYGFMFDLDSGGLSGLPPRRGCAVFLAPIVLKAQVEGVSDSDMREFVAFTAIHELGHVFNLWHSADGAAAFMAPHPDPAGPLGRAFEDDQTAYLKLIADPQNARFVAPGGSDFGERAAGFPQGANPAAGLEGPTPRLDLRIAPSQEVLDAFDPLELYVTAVSRDAEQAIILPDEMHPSFARFEVWITTPQGERRRHRPNHRYCRPGRDLVLRPGESAHREVWLGPQAGVSMFGGPGRYTIEARLQTDRGSAVISNRVEVEVLAARPSDGAWTMKQRTFGTPAVRNTLRYRRVISRSAYEALKELSDAVGTPETQRTIAYALGVALQKASGSRPASNRSRAIRERSLAHLQQALAHETHPGRRARIESLIGEGESRDVERA